MNRSAEIIAYLTQQEGPAEIIIAPNAPPVTRAVSGVELALNVVLDPGDVSDTLMALRARSPQPEMASLPESGSFSFGMSNVGRFRVSYVSQRGSKALRVIRVPFQVPRIDTVSEDREAIDILSDAILSRRHGVMAISGSSSIANSKLVYALLNLVNSKMRLVICIVERCLTFLMAHGNSIVVQTEMGNDVHTIEDGVRSAFLLEPDVLFVGDVWSADQVPSLARAVETGMMTILSSVALTGEELLRRFAGTAADDAQGGAESVRYAVQVLPAEDGRIRVRVQTPKPAGASRK